jgi:plastocyanin
VFESRFEIFGWALSILVVVVMGVIVFTGPYHRINKVQAKSSAPATTVKIVTDPKTIGRYTPATARVKVGQKILFVNVSNAPHTVTGNGFDSGTINTNRGRYTQSFSKPGRYHYYCTFHPGMHGTIVVSS